MYLREAALSLLVTKVDDLSSWIDNVLHRVDTFRLDANKQLDPHRKIEFGQFLTPMSLARLMASMLECREPIVSLLDPCAGVGSLLAASVAELCLRSNPPREIHVTAYEIDATLATYLPDTFKLCEEMCEHVGILFTGEVRQVDFIENIVNDTTVSLFTQAPLLSFNCVVLNPPYRKIQSNSKLSKMLQLNGVKTTNLYTGFLLLCMHLLSDSGEMVAITPRSFCSGSYFKPFRKSLLRTMTLRRLHLFESRQNTFQEDEVLQETMILSAVKASLVPETVLVTSTHGPNDSFAVTREVPYDEVVSPDDPEFCIRIVSDEGGKQIAPMNDDQKMNPILSKKRIEEALAILKDLGFPRQQQNERSALTLLALLDLKSDQSWSEAKSPLCGITQMMNFFAQYYGKKYAPNSRETVRRQTVHQFLDAGIIVANPDNPGRPINSGQTVYQIEPQILNLLKKYGSPAWEASLREYLVDIETLQKRYAQERELSRIPVRVVKEQTITLSPGGQNVLVELIIREFAERFVPGGRLLYVGDTDEKFAYFDEQGLAEVGVTLELHGKIPDIILHDETRNWLVLIEAVTSHGPVTPMRQEELKRIFGQSHAGLVFVTAFLDRKALKKEFDNIS